MNPPQKPPSFWRLLVMDCREAARSQSEQLEHSLTGCRRLGLFLHLLMCLWCRRYGRQLRFLHQAARTRAETLADSGAETLPPETRRRIIEKLREGK